MRSRREEILLTRDVLERLQIPESPLRTWIRNGLLQPSRLSNGEYYWNSEEFEQATVLANKWMRTKEAHLDCEHGNEEVK